MTRAQLERWSPLVVLAAVLVLWEAMVRALQVPDYLFPAPWAIAAGFKKTNSFEFLPYQYFFVFERK